MEGQIRPRMRAYAEEHTAAFSRHAARHDFTEVERLLESLRSLQACFPDENLVNLEGFEATLWTARAQYTAQQQRAEERQRAEEATQRAEEERIRARREREAMEEQMRRREAELEEVRRRRGRGGPQIQLKIEIPCTIS